MTYTHKSSDVNRAEIRDSGEVLSRVFWVTVMVYAAAIMALSIREINLGELVDAAFVFAICVLHYWPIFFFACLPAEDLQRQDWRVSGAWLCLTAPIAVYLIEAYNGFDPEGLALSQYLLKFAGPLWLPLVTTFIGALVGDLLLTRHRAGSRGMTASR